MSEKNICLVGFMGSGKSMISKKLGELLGRTVVSTDEEIQKREGKPISDIFTGSGEEYFRNIEKDVVKDLASQSAVIIDCGGGVILNQENVNHLKNNGVLVYLQASPEFLYEQIKQQPTRPLLAVEDPLAKIKELLNEREAQYKQADYTVVSENKMIDQVAEEVRDIVTNN